MSNSFHISKFQPFQQLCCWVLPTIPFTFYHITHHITDSLLLSFPPLYITLSLCTKKTRETQWVTQATYLRKQACPWNRTQLGREQLETGMGNAAYSGFLGGLNFPPLSFWRVLQTEWQKLCACGLGLCRDDLQTEFHLLPLEDQKP